MIQENYDRFSQQRGGVHFVETLMLPLCWKENQVALQARSESCLPLTDYQYSVYPL